MEINFWTYLLASKNVCTKLDLSKCAFSKGLAEDIVTDCICIATATAAMVGLLSWTCPGSRMVATIVVTSSRGRLWLNLMMVLSRTCASWSRRPVSCLRAFSMRVRPRLRTVSSTSVHNFMRLLTDRRVMVVMALSITSRVVSTTMVVTRWFRALSLWVVYLNGLALMLTSFILLIVLGLGRSPRVTSPMTCSSLRSFHHNSIAIRCL